MRVLAARFPNRERASAALGSLHHRFQLSPPDVAIAPMGVPGEVSRNDTLLAGRFSEDRTDDVCRLIHEAGGEVVANVDERWTRSHAAQHERDAEPEVTRIYS